jgi:hypothetical protein
LALISLKNSKGDKEMEKKEVSFCEGGCGKKGEHPKWQPYYFCKKCENESIAIAMDELASCKDNPVRDFVNRWAD